LIFGIRIYQWTVSPVLGFLAGPFGRCRFSPTCSQYAIEAVRAHGAARGGALALWRICRCQPWGGCGDDPVPPKKQEVGSTEVTEADCARSHGGHTASG
jgi:putative membrane protein insertion efficiency factor